MKIKLKVALILLVTIICTVIIFYITKKLVLYIGFYKYELVIPFTVISILLGFSRAWYVYYTDWCNKHRK